MNKNELIEIIREVVRTELRSVGPALVRVALLETLQGNVESDTIAEVSAPIARKSVATVRPTNLTEHKVIKKEMKIYSSNPILNQILNDTEGGIPQEKSVEEAPSVLDMIGNAPESMLTENKEMAAVHGALKKDYRALLKAVDAKKKFRP